jgi:hypothetical protein
VEVVASLPAEHRCAVFVDRPPVESLESAPELNRLGYRIVPVVQRWCASPAVVPSEALAQALVEAGQSVAPLDDPRGVVFILDGDRLGNRTPSGADPRRARSGSLFDNRHEYPIDRFPPPDYLRGDGVTAVLWIGAGHIADDLQGYARRLAEGGLGPEIVQAGED